MPLINFYFAGPIFDPGYLWFYFYIVYGLGSITAIVTLGWLFLRSSFRKGVTASWLQAASLSLSFLTGTSLIVWLDVVYFKFWEERGLAWLMLLISIAFSLGLFMFMRLLRYSKWALLGWVTTAIIVWVFSPLLF